VEAKSTTLAASLGALLIGAALCCNGAGNPEARRRLMRQFEKHVLDEQAHEVFLLWWYRMVPYRSYVKGWKISPSHYLNQDLATVWLDK
jgi:peptide/nickel transport system substrate-binding protein